MRIGIDLGGTKIEGVVLDRDGDIVARNRVPTPKGDYRGTVDAIVELVRHLDEETRRTAHRGHRHAGDHLARSPAA